MELYSVDLDLDRALEGPRVCPVCKDPMVPDQTSADGGFRCNTCGTSWRLVLGTLCATGRVGDRIPTQRTAD